MFLTICAADPEGRFIPSFCLEVKAFHIHGFTQGGMLIDLTHLDDEKERVFLEGDQRPFAPMKLEQMVRINTITVHDGFPGSRPLTKAQYRERVGCGALRNKSGHFVRQTGG